MYSWKFVLLPFFTNLKQRDIKIMGERSFLSSLKHCERNEDILRKLPGTTTQKIEIINLPIKLIYLSFPQIP